MINKSQYNSAKKTIKEYENQINTERQRLFLKSLKKYDNTYWLYKRPMQTIYMSAHVRDRAIFVVRYIENSNGLLEIKTSHFDSESIENYLKTLSEFTHDSIFTDDSKYIFSKINKGIFNKAIFKKILFPMGLTFE